MEDTKNKNKKVDLSDYAKKKQKDKNKPKNPKIEELEKKLQETNNSLLRIKADYENYKKRVEKEKIDIRKYASMDLISELLISLDQLKIVCDYPVENELLKNYLIGFKMINDKIFETLQNNGLKELEVLNKPFDPITSHAIEKKYIENKEPNIVIQEIQKGYMYKEKLLRPAMVKVSDEKPEEKNNENIKNENE